MSGDADSTTKSAISNGTITVTGNQKQDLSKLNRDPSGVLNALGKIFDKKTVQEKQELTNLFAQEAYKAIGDLALKKQNEAISKAKAAKKGDLKKATQLYEEAKNIASNWQDGGASKIALHAVVGGLIGQISGGNAASEAFSAGTNEASYNSKLIQNLSPELKEFTSIVIGAGVAKLTGGNSKSGASVALSGTKNNNILHDIGWDTLGNLLDETEEVIKEKREAGSQANNDYMKMNTEGYNSTITSEETYGDNISEKQIENAQEIKENIKRVVSTSDDTTKNEVPPPTVDQVLDQGGTWNSAGQLVGSDGTIYENSPNRGDYLYSKGIEPKVNKETNTWYISTADGDCQVYSLGYVGDYYAKLGYKVYLGADGGHYTIAPDGSPLNTSADVIWEEQNKGSGTQSTVRNSWDYATGLGRGILGLPNLPGSDYSDKSNAFKYGYSEGTRAMPWVLILEGLKTPASNSPGFAVGYNGTLAQTVAVDAWKSGYLGSTIINASTNNSNSGDNEANTEISSTADRVYAPNPKHDAPGGKISPNPFGSDAAAGQEALETAYSSSGTKQLYNVHDGKLVKFQPDNAGGYHPYEVINPAKEVPTDVLRQMKNDGVISNAQYNKWIKNQ